MNLTCQGLAKRFGAVRAVAHADFAVRGGEVVGLVGENGAGKSTMIGLLCGQHRPDAGTIEVDGRPTALDPRRAHELRIAAIRQEPVLVPPLSVAENLLLDDPPERLGFVRGREQRALAARWLADVGAEIAPTQTVGALSPADRQLVEIARAGGRGARVLFFDEPTAALSPAETERLFALIARLAAEGTAIVYVSHRLEEIFAICSRIVVMRDGRTVAEGAAEAFDERSLVQAMAGRELLALEVAEERRHHAAADAPLLAASGLRLHGRLHDVAFDVRRGEVHGVAGIVGSGRTSLVEVLGGVVRPDGGTMTLGGARYAPHGPGAAIATGVALVPEDRHRCGLLAHMSEATNVVFSRYRAAARAGTTTRRREAEAAGALLERLDVRPRDAQRPGGTLSGGNQQKLVVGRALFTGPRLLLLDEPTRGVDVGAKADVHRLVRELVEQEGLAVVLVSSDLRELIALSDRVSVMARGQLVTTFSGALDAERIVAAATGARWDHDEERSIP